VKPLTGFTIGITASPRAEEFASPVMPQVRRWFTPAIRRAPRPRPRTRAGDASHHRNPPAFAVVNTGSRFRAKIGERPRRVVQRKARLAALVLTPMRPRWRSDGSGFETVQTVVRRLSARTRRIFSMRNGRARRRGRNEIRQPCRLGAKARL
jgi:hypothetical protein